MRFQEENWNWNVCLHGCFSLSLHDGRVCRRPLHAIVTDGSGLKLMQRVLKNDFVSWVDARGGGFDLLAWPEFLPSPLGSHFASVLGN